MKVDYEWQRLYAAAVLETDRSRLSQLIEQASAAINRRVLELNLDSQNQGYQNRDYQNRDHQNQDRQAAAEERAAIEFALSGLKILSEDVAKT